MTSLRVPRSTYRIQLTPDFRFSDAQRIVPFLHRLGISDLYCSPILTARPGSQHGYDVTNPNQLNPELGTPEDFDSLVAELRRYQMGLLLDIVPNHMAASTDNEWWIDVLENGLASPYARYFDIEWDSHITGEILQNRVLLPILGGPYGETLEKGELKLAASDNGFHLVYYETSLPLSPGSYLPVLTWHSDELEERLGADSRDWREYSGLMRLVEDLHESGPATAARSDALRRVRGAVRRRLRKLRQNPVIREHIEQALEAINGQPGDPRSFDQLDQIIGEQAYRLAFWQLARERINYRRFFDINDLVSMRVEDPEVFNQTHGFVLALARSQKVTGLRIDHIDGLRDPFGYLERLRQALAGKDAPDEGCDGFYVVAEKILSDDERLPDDWPLCGTTGYDFMNEISGLFLDPEHDRTLDNIYRRWSGTDINFPDLAYEKKQLVLHQLFAANVRAMSLWLDQIAETDRHGRDIPLESLEDALVEVTASLPVYRTYIRDFEVEDHDRRWIERALSDAARHRGDLGHALGFLRRLLLLETPSYLTEDERENWLAFVLRWQQFTGPVMAKGYEDTALYIYNRLVSQNEVGGHPERPGIAPGDFYSYCLERAEHWPHSISASSTHDTKRGEDVRARLAVLSELADEWEQRLDRWATLNADKRTVFEGQAVPDGNVELLIYQTMLGAWPLSDDDLPQFRERLNAYFVKAAREAKTHTDWAEPNQQYEDALNRYVDTLLDPAQSEEFLADFVPFQEKVAYYGALTSLSQLILKLTAPGMPDFYQGSELWNLSLVDPDNRRPVNYELRERYLTELSRAEDQSHDVAALIGTWRDGRCKLAIAHRLLQLRNQLPDVLSDGHYLPLEVQGPLAGRAIAFARRSGESWLVVVVPRLVAALSEPEELPAGATWAETQLQLPEDAPSSWRNSLTGETVRTSVEHAVALDQLFATLPYAVLLPT